jgi:hypothetical protein
MKALDTLILFVVEHSLPIVLHIYFFHFYVNCCILIVLMVHVSFWSLQNSDGFCQYGTVVKKSESSIDSLSDCCSSDLPSNNLPKYYNLTI